MNHYEVTFIIDPVLSGDEIKSTAKAYTSLLENEGCGLTFHNEMGLQQLAYPINKRQSGIYFCTEFSTETGDIIPKLELAMRRDERVMRFLTVKLDKFGVKYNEDKRNGLIGSKKKVKKEDDASSKSDKPASATKAAPVKKAPAKAAPAVKAAPVEKATPAVKADDLTKIEGIGPKISELLINAGINTFTLLATADVAKIEGILKDAGGQFATHKPTTWSKQSQMAANGNWDELQKWQDELNGGIEVAKNEEE